MSTGPQGERGDPLEDYFIAILQDALDLHQSDRLHGVAIIFSDPDGQAYTKTYGDRELVAAMGRAISERKREEDEKLAKMEAPSKTRN